jgi:hypothetical protein
VAAALLMLIGTSWAIREWGIEGAAYARTAVFGGFVVASQLCFLFWVERKRRRATPKFDSRS